MLAAVVVFALVTFAWVFFRAPTLECGDRLHAQAVSDPAGAGGYGRFVPTLLLSAALLVYEWLTRGWEHGLSIAALPLPARWGAYLGLCMALLIFGYLGTVRGSMSSSRRRGAFALLVRVAVFALVFAALAEVWLRAVMPACRDSLPATRTQPRRSGVTSRRVHGRACTPWGGSPAEPASGTSTKPAATVPSSTGRPSSADCL